MDKTIKYTILYDYYKNLLTEKQQEYFEEYYFNNLSFTEIAENNGISKAAVHGAISKTKELLNEYESKLNLSKNRLKIKEKLKEEEYKKIKEYL